MNLKKKDIFTCLHTPDNLKRHFYLSLPLRFFFPSPSSSLAFLFLSFFPAEAGLTASSGSSPFFPFLPGVVFSADLGGGDDSLSSALLGLFFLSSLVGDAFLGDLPFAGGGAAASCSS